jgi:hypothetical protein
MHLAFSSVQGRVDLNLKVPMFNVCSFHAATDGVFVLKFCDADAAGVLAISGEGAVPDGVLLFAPDISTPAATATTKLKYAGALLADMIIGLLRSRD